MQLWDPFKDFEKQVLPNGLTVYASAWEGRAWQGFAFLVHSGAIHDPRDRHGVAHFVEHMVNANGVVEHEEIKRFFQEQGGSAYFGGTSFLSTVYKFNVPAIEEVCACALSLFGSMLISAQLTKLLERERKVILGEFQQNFPTPFSYAQKSRQHRMIYPNTPYADHPCPLGTPESISAIQESDLQAFYDLHYVPSNMSVVSLGGMPISDVARLLSESAFGFQKPGKRNVSPAYVVPERPREQEHVVSLKEEMRGMESAIYKTVALIPNTKHPITLIHVVGEMLSDVLSNIIREKHAWTYGIHTESERLEEFTRFSIKSQSIAPEAIPHIGRVVGECIESLNHRDDLFERVKGEKSKGHFLLDMTGKEVIDCVVDDLLSHGRILPLLEIRDELESITMDDVREVLAYLAPERRWTLLLTP